MNPKVFVSQLEDKQAVSSSFLVREKLLLQDKNGKPYLSLTLGDSTGSVDAKMWEHIDQFSHGFHAGDVVSVRGHVQVYQNRKQLVIQDVRKMSDGSYSINDFLGRSERDPAEMYQQLLALVEDVQDRNLKQLILNTLQDPQTRTKLLMSPAAKTIHHAYLGGLIEHTLSIAQVMKFLAQHYAFLNFDLLIFGAIFHDLGKIWELEYESGIGYSDRGRLVGHMGIACEMIDRRASQIFGFPDELKDICKHIVLSHHGKLEYGSPKLPQLLEAVVVAMVDDLDSRLNTLEKFMRAELNTQEKWTRYHSLHERHMYLPIFKERLSTLDKEKSQ